MLGLRRLVKTQRRITICSVITGDVLHKQPIPTNIYIQYQSKVWTHLPKLLTGTVYMYVCVCLCTSDSWLEVFIRLAGCTVLFAESMVRSSALGDGWAVITSVECHDYDRVSFPCWHRAQSWVSFSVPHQHSLRV